MGWYKEYLQDLADIKAAEDRQSVFGCLTIVIWLVCCGLAAYAGTCWLNDEYLKALGLCALCLLLQIPTFFSAAKGGCGGCGGAIGVIIGFFIITFIFYRGTLTEGEFLQKVKSVEFLQKVKSEDSVNACKYNASTPNKKNIDLKKTPSYAKDIKKIPSYVKDIEQISSSEELSSYYYKIADKFKAKQIKIKACSSNITEGSKTMSSVYNFLGKAAKGNYADFNNLKKKISNNKKITKACKNTAIQDIYTGINKINTLDGVHIYVE